MAKPKVPSTPTGRQRIPLKDVTVTWIRDARFVGEKGPQSVTLTGEQLAPLLGWLTTVAPGNVEGYFREDVTWRLPNLSKAIQATCQAADPDEALDGCRALGDCLEDLSARIASFKDRTAIAAKAFVTIPSGPSKAAVA